MRSKGVRIRNGTVMATGRTQFGTSSYVMSVHFALGDQICLPSYVKDEALKISR